MMLQESQRCVRGSRNQPLRAGVVPRHVVSRVRAAASSSATTPTSKPSGPLSSLDSLDVRRASAEEAMQWFRVPPKIYFKGGCLETALNELRGKHRAFVITDKTMFDLEYAEKITTILDTVNVQHQIFYHVPHEPTESTIAAGLREMADFSPDVIIAVGGGAPMDAAKAMWLLYEAPQLTLAGLVEEAGTGRHRVSQASMGKRALCICVPTTSGTGAEVTPFAVVKEEATGRKLTVADYSLTPSMAIVDPQLVMQLPRAQTAYGGQLTLSHAMESYISVFASDYSRGLSKHAMSMMTRYYERAYRNGNMDFHAREKMHNAATVAGMAFANTYLGLCHALASEVSSVSGCHLGLASGVLLPHVLAFMARDAKTKEAIADLSEHLHVGGTTLSQRYSNVMGWVNKMRAAADIPDSLQTALGPTGFAVMQAKIDSVCQGSLDNAHLMASPMQPTVKDMKDILAAASS